MNTRTVLYDGTKVQIDAEIDQIAAALEHAEEEDIESWPVLKLQTKAKTWQRILGYMTCTIAEARGTQWKRGNPWPSLFYDRVSEGNTALRPVEESTRGMGQA